MSTVSSWLSLIVLTPSIISDSHRSRSRPNGTATFSLRRPSLATSASQQPQSAGVYVPPHSASHNFTRNGNNADARYGKEQMLNVFKSQKENGEIGKNMSDYLVAGWNPGQPGEPISSSWSKRDEHSRDHTGHGPEVCWDSNGSVLPLATLEMTEEEREVCLIALY